MKNTKTVQVKASGNYDIVIGEGILGNIGEILSDIKKPAELL